MPKVFLSPSNQSDNSYAYGNTNEAAECGKMAAAAKTALIRCGFEVMVMQWETAQERCKAANEWGADLYIPIHTNAYNNSVTGTRTFVYEKSGDSYEAAKVIHGELAAVTPGTSESISTYPELIELNQPNAPAVYLEVDFHDVASVAKWLIENTTLIGETICKGICKYFGVTYVAAGSTPPVVEPTYISANRYLSLEEMQINATYIYWYLSHRGWTLNAIAGMLGNMQTESTINPGIWQNLAVNVGPAFGLVQWDPYTKYTDWCAQRSLNPSVMWVALSRIEWELANGEQYYPTSDYPETFAEFKVSTKEPYYLGMAFLRNYERPADQNQPSRGTQAEYWYEYLSGVDIPPGGGDDPGGGGSTTTKRGRYKFFLFNKQRRIFS